jgi:short-subunit dehydrogenase
MATGTCVLITGATSGIGERLALDYAFEGWDVYACGRNKTKLKALKEQSGRIQTFGFDVTQLKSVSIAFAKLPKTPDLWLFNAGDCLYLDDGVMDVDVFQKMLKINVMGLANCMQAAQGFFKPGQHIAMMGSIASEVALPRAEAYGASKAAVCYYARSVALALRQQGLQVSLIFPGFVQTPLTDKNTFPMPMRISCHQASMAIRKGLAAKKEFIYFPAVFTWLLRLIALLPYSAQKTLISYLVPTQPSETDRG